MNARNPAESRTTVSLPAHRVLEGLSRIHRWMLLVDEERRVVWMSDGLREIPGVEDFRLGDDARSFLAKLPKPEQVFPLRSDLRDRSQLRGFPLQIRGPRGEGDLLDLDLLRIESEEGDMIVVVASEHVSREESGLDHEMIDAIPDALLALDCDGFVRRANTAACQLLGFSSEELIARPITALLPPDADQIEALADALQGPAREASCEIRFPGDGGCARTLDVAVAPMRDERRVLVLRDVTDRATEMQRLERSNEELDHSIGSLAHDLRSPLVGLLGFSRLLQQDYARDLDDTGRHFVDRIEQASRTMQRLIEDLLGLAKVGSPGERPALVDSQAVLRQLAAELKPRLEETGIDLVLPEGGVSPIYCDRPRLYQVFSNLIGNAIDHMGPRSGARIEVQVNESDDGHEIVVCDNGRGVDPADRRRIFEIFQSVGKRADGCTGTGMGLAIVKKIVERRGGRVWVDSNPTGGASFHATFPRS